MDPLSRETWDDEEINQARVDFEDWCMQQESKDLENYIRQRKFSSEIANRIREQIALEEHLFAERPDQLLMDSINEFELQGTQIGDYRLLRQLGQGGMGTVWLAQQEKRVKRRVAIKLIKPGFDSQEFVRRFSVERQALAIMSHHNIARVLDAGLTSAGRPYFVMEYIPGVSIIKYCERHELNSAARLRLFLQLCSAIQHAHQKGVIHRDIKPSNVLVADVDGELTLKVIDFGLAKAFDTELDGALASITHERVMLGSPLWMSPEQIGGPFGLTQRKADTRSDVYSLGVVLYQLLTGTTPIRHESYLALEFGELAKRIQDEIPPPPSERLRKQNAPETKSQTEVAPQSDLDWIVLKALEKDPDRRYDGVGALANDIQRYLDREPIQARRPSRRYQLRMFLTRHRMAASFVTALVMMLIVGTTISTALAVWAFKERATAIALQKQAEKAAENLLIESEYLQDGLADPFESAFIQFRPSPVDDVSKLIQKVNQSNYFDKPHTEAVARQVAGRFAFRAGEFQEARRQFERAYYLFTQPNTENRDRSNNCMIYLAKIAYLLEDYSKAVELFQQLAEQNSFDTETPPSTWNLGNSIRLAACYQKNGDIEKATQLGEEVCQLLDKHHPHENRFWIMAHSTLARIYLDANKFNDADRVANKIWNYMQSTRLAHVPASKIECFYCLIAVNEVMNRHTESIALLKQAINTALSHFSNDHELLIDLQVSLANLLAKTGNEKDAYQKLRLAVSEGEQFLGATHQQTIEAKSILEILTIKNPNLIIQVASDTEADPAWKELQLTEAINFFENLIAKSQHELGNLYIRTNSAEEAVPLLRESTAYFEDEFGPQSPKARGPQRLLVTALYESGEREAAIQLGDDIVEQNENLHPSLDDASIELYHELSNYHFDTGGHSEAIRLAEKVFNHYLEDLKAEHLPTQEALFALRSLYLRTGQIDEALQMQKSYCDQITDKFTESNTSAIFEQKNYAVALQLAGRVHEATRQFQKALSLCNEHCGAANPNSIIYLGYFQNHFMANEEFDQAKPLIDKWLSLISPNSRQYYNRRAWALVSLADYHASVDQFSEAKNIIAEMPDLIDSVPAHSPGPAQRELTRLKSVQGLCLAHEGRFTEAKQLATEAYESLLEETSCINWAYHRWYLIRCIDRLIEIHELGDEPQEVEHWKKHRVAMQKHLADTLHTIEIK